MKNKEHEMEVIGQVTVDLSYRMSIISPVGYQGGTSPLLSYVSQHASKSDPAVLNHPAIKHFLEFPSRSSSPLDQGSDAHYLGPSVILSQQGEGPDRGPGGRMGAGRRAGRAGTQGRYVPPDNREENVQSTHKWMVYVRGSRREPSIDHFVKKVWFFLQPQLQAQ
ncbi:YEATS domain-containing protein 2-like [Salvelinus alpinus]